MKESTWDNLALGLFLAAVAWVVAGLALFAAVIVG